jgi:hypothetical protein
VQKILSDGQSPTIEPSKFFAFDFKGKFAQFGFSAVSSSIDNDRSIFRAINHSGHYAPMREKTVTVHSTGRSYAPCTRRLSPFGSTP